jgi:hypothetical protein
MTVLHLGGRASVQGVEVAASARNEMGATGETAVRKARARRLDVDFHVESRAPEAVVSKEARKCYSAWGLALDRRPSRTPVHA